MLVIFCWIPLLISSSGFLINKLFMLNLIIKKIVISQMTEKIAIRLAKSSDIPDLVRLRRLMFRWMGFTDEESLDKNDLANEQYFIKNIPNGGFIGWLAQIDKEKTVGCGGLVIDQHPPGPSNLSGKIGYIMNISVDPEFRHQGVAKEILKTILLYLKINNITVSTLHASEMGKSLYEKTGYKPTNEMRLQLADLNKSYLDIN